MELATIARPYAIAAFKVAKDGATLDSWSRMLSVLAAAMGHQQVNMLLESPELPSSHKAFKLGEVCGDQLGDVGKKFLAALAEHDRLGLLPEIQVQFEVLKAEEEKSIEVEVISAFEFSDKHREKVKEALKARFSKLITIEVKVDPALIGGAIIRAGDMVIDGSIKGKLTKLAESLNKN